MKRNDVHSLESVAVSVAAFAIVVCSLAAHGDSLSGGPLNVGASQASTQNSSQASTQARTEAELKVNTLPARAATNSRLARKHHSASNGRALQRLINTPAIMGSSAPRRKAVVRSSKRIASAKNSRKAHKKWKVVSYNWRTKKHSTSYR